MNTKTPAVYILTNKYNGTLYSGVTLNLEQRIQQHKKGIFTQFAQRYDCKILVYYEYFSTMQEAIMREKHLKGKIRKFKIELIESINPFWEDLTTTSREFSND